MSAATGLLFPGDLAGWQHWNRRQRRVGGALRSAKARVRPAPTASPVLHLPPDTVRTLVVIDVLSPSCRAAMLEPLRHLDPRHTAVLSPVADPGLPASGTWQPRAYAGTHDLPATIETVCTLGAFLPIAGPVSQWAKQRGMRHIVVQHGLLTPWSPPLADGDHLLAWSEADAAYLTGGHDGVTSEIVGSQLLWSAAQLPPADIRDDGAVVLGQLHGTEMARHTTFGVYWRFCRSTGANYRPHPNESDAASRALHRAMRAGGISFEGSGDSLADLGRPVVSIFSTGTLEAAQRGLPAWVIHPDPPPWLRDFWHRYHLGRWGEAPTPHWEDTSEEPAAAVATAMKQ
ncbi:prephenate dehydrogenase [Rudaeicoccus suwonensis]|uniref:Uncharacterized protein n=1 Tax=Rudaeicoccus suwonensis TaxID=657409 RepID=A0A561E8R5_9MICO|nr:prephenate dehydrogenase [Rudaeicoccus suwonensis]TWE12003.1 hypothetical protein BKA23_0799 [Rudaeicoccus suwonensis]